MSAGEVVQAVAAFSACAFLAGGFGYLGVVAGRAVSRFFRLDLDA